LSRATIPDWGLYNPCISFAIVLFPHPLFPVRPIICLGLISKSTFFNLLSTVELSKCQPYLNVVFVLPSLITSTTNLKVYKTASITQFFDGTPVSSNDLTSVYKTLEANFKRTVGSDKTQKTQNAVATNMSAFTMPQTVNNFNEKFIGHNSNNVFNTDMDFYRSNSVHDITRPFLTVKSFSIDVAPTQGLMSFKTGKLSLILHDKTRMVDIAPFVKPDLFGSFGAEIAIEYGWSHIDGKTNKSDTANYLGKFLDSNKVTEKFIITNSSFSMDNTGQVNIDLSIAMRGPVDIRSVKLHSDPPGLVRSNSLSNTEQIYLDTISILNDSGLIVKKDDPAQRLFIREDITSTISSETRLLNSDIKELAKASKKLVNTKKIAEIKQIKIKKKYTLKTFKKALDDLDKSKKKIRPLGLIRIDGLTKENIDQYKITDDSQAQSAIRLFLEQINNYIASIKTAYVDDPQAFISKQDSLIKKIIGGLDKVDPFYNTEWLNQYSRIIESKDITDGVPIQGIGTKRGSTSYVTFGSFITGLIGTHLGSTGKFNEIQIISYTCNENAGLFSNMNVSSLLLPRIELRSFLASIFEDGATFTLESIISQVINRFINTRTQICYGLSGFYKIDSKTGNVEAKYKKDKQIKHINDRLSLIYTELSKNTKKPPAGNESIERLDDVRFVMPKISFTFDTLTSRTSGYDTTISRISIFDQNDNPFGSINTIMKDFNDRGIITASAQLNKLRSKYSSKFIDKEGKVKKQSSSNKQLIAKERFYKNSWEIIKKLIDDGKLVEISDGIYEISGQFKLEGLKNSFKKIMPSITYGTQNSAIIEASISTVNEAKLNTIYLTRSDRSADRQHKIATKVGFSKDLPLRVLPSQATVTMYGCPFVNFAQYFFLDFETGTTIDNAYAVTGIKHDISPGKFTTQLTLSYGDVYGKYENAASSIARAINDIASPTLVKKADSDLTEINILGYSKSGDEVGSRKILSNLPVSLSASNINLNFRLNIVKSYRNIVWIEKNSSTSGYDVYITLNENSSDPKNNASGKRINIKLDLLRDTKLFNTITYDSVVMSMFKEIKAVENKKFTLENYRLLNKKVFEDNEVDFIKDIQDVKKKKKKVVKEDFRNLIGKIKDKKLITLKLNISFNYTGQETIDSDEITRSLDLDWNLFERNKILDLFNEIGDLDEARKMKVTKNYKEAVRDMLVDSKVDIIQEVKPSVKSYKSYVNNKNATIKNYVKPGSILFTTAGLEMQVISGIKYLGKQKVKNKEKIVCQFDYDKVLIDWQLILDHVINLKKDKTNL